MRKILSIVCCLWAANAYSAEVSPYIVNGLSVGDAELRNMPPPFASLYFHDGRRYGNFCGAVMIDSQHVLTAAHCVHDNNSPDTFKMMHMWAVPTMADESQYNNGSYQSGRVAEIYYRSDYNGSPSRPGRTFLPNDIAILKLESPLNIGSFSSYINSSTDDDELLTSHALDRYIAVGRGYVASPNSSSNGFVLQTDLTLKARSVCGSDTIDGQLCFDGRLQNGFKNSTCNGDSGGPLYWQQTSGQYKLVGITSYGPTTCGDVSEFYTSVFTEVQKYHGWISDVLNGTERPKFSIEKDSIERRLKNSSGDVVISSSRLLNDRQMPFLRPASTSSESSSSSGGSFGLALLTVLGFVRYRRNK